MKHRMKIAARLEILTLSVAAVLAAAGTARAADGTWIGTSSAAWSNGGSWAGANVADGATFTAAFDAPLSGSITITLDSARTIGNLSFTDSNGPANNYTISGANTLTLNANGSGGGVSTIAVNTGTAVIGGSGLVLAGGSNISKTGAGVLTLATDNTGNPFTGDISVGNGTLRATGANALAGVDVTLDTSTNNATLSFGVNSAMTMGSLTVASGGSGTATLEYTTANGNTLAGAMTLDKSLTVNTVTSANLITTGLISGAGGILKTGNGTLTLRRSNNTFQGGVTVSAGGLRLNGGGNVAGTQTIVVGDANTGSANVNVSLNQNGANILNNIQFTNNGSGSALLQSYDTDSGSATTLAGNVLLDRSIDLRNINTTAGRNFTLTGTLSGVGGITTSVSNSANRLILTAANTFQGGTTVNAGTLLVNNTAGSGLGSGNVTVNGGALGGTGAFSGALTVHASGTLSPGTSIETLASGAVTLNGGSTFAYEVDSGVPTSAGADLLVASGGLSLDGTVTLTLANLDVTPEIFADGTTFTLVNYNGAWNNGLFTYDSNVLSNGETFSFNGQDWRIDYDATSGGLNYSGQYLPSSNFVNITAVPEPHTVVSLGLGMAAVLWPFRKRRAQA